MERFVHHENLAHYRRLLAEPDVADDPVRHKVLMQLLADETAKEAEHDGKGGLEGHHR